MMTFVDLHFPKLCSTTSHAFHLTWNRGTFLSLREEEHYQSKLKQLQVMTSKIQEEMLDCVIHTNLVILMEMLMGMLVPLQTSLAKAIFQSATKTVLHFLHSCQTLVERPQYKHLCICRESLTQPQPHPQ
jgi:hypothetical protein